jgi:putative transposase
MDSQDRHRPNHLPPVERFNKPVVILVTVCSQLRASVFARNEVHHALKEAWGSSSQWRVGYYVIMPDHIHLFCVPGVIHPEPLGQWVPFWKRRATVCESSLKGMWQRDFWDTQMRDWDHYQEKVEYVKMNPVRKALVQNPEEWRFQGELNPVSW